MSEPTQAQPGELPPLPEPDIRVTAFGEVEPLDRRQFVRGDFFNPYQMQAYARAALASKATPASTVQAGVVLDGWRTIESAPKDGRHMLLGYFHHEGCESSQLVAFWHSIHKKWCNTHTLFEADGPFSPTHWKPLPATPGSAPPPAKMRMLTEEEVNREAMRWNLPGDSAESFAFYKLSHAEQIMKAFKDGLKRGVELAGLGTDSPDVQGEAG